MTIGRDGRWIGRGGALLALTLLGGCGAGNALSGLYGSAPDQPITAPATATAPDAPVRLPIDTDKECPYINVPAGTSAYAPGGTGSPDLRYQVVIGSFARECVLESGTSVRIRIGVEGRVLLGTKGAPGTYSAPLRIAVKDRSDAVVYSRVVSVSATVPAGDDQANFRVVDEGAVVALAPETPLRAYQIEVGFGGKDAPVKKKRRG